MPWNPSKSYQDLSTLRNPDLAKTQILKTNEQALKIKITNPETSNKELKSTGKIYEMPWNPSKSIKDPSKSTKPFKTTNPKRSNKPELLQKPFEFTKS